MLNISVMSKSQNTHRKQHFVPRCYTKPWIDPSSLGAKLVEPYVWVLAKDRTNAKRRAPSNLFVETDIYTTTAADGSRDLRLEHGFPGLEDAFTRIRTQRFDAKAWPDADEWTRVLAFVAVAHARTAAFRNFHRDQWGAIRERMEAAQKALDKATAEQRAAFRPTPPSLGEGKSMGIEEVRQFERTPIQHLIGPTLATVLPAYAAMTWCVLQTDDPIGFVTTDSPVTWFDPEAYKLQPIYRGPGLHSGTIEITMPLSPSQCLLITHNPNQRGFRNISQSTLNDINRRHIAHCADHFVSNTSETRPVWFEHREMPSDAWEKVRERKIASGEWRTSQTYTRQTAPLK